MTNEVIGADYPFMKEVKYERHQIFTDGVESASQGIPVGRLILTFRDYTYAFLHIVQALTSDILMERGKM